MGSFKKFIINAIIFALIVPLNSIPIPAKAAPASKSAKPALFIDGTAVPGSGKTEIESKRTTNSRTYLKSDGTKELQLFNEPINYLSEKRKMEVIDSSITEKQTTNDGGRIYKNKAGSFEINLGENLFQNGASIASGQNKVSFGPKQTFSPSRQLAATSLNNYLPSQTKPIPNKIEVAQNSISNTDLSGNITYKYYSINQGLKEEIELKSYTGQNTFYFNLNLQNVHFDKKNGAYNFYDNTTNKQVFYLPPSFAYDQNKDKPEMAEEAYNYNLSTEITNKNGQYLLTLIVDNSWLKDAKRKYPVIIDPTIYPSQGGWNDDTYVQSGYPTSNSLAWNQAYLYAGYWGSPYYKRWMHMYLPFDGPSTLGDRIVVDSANVSIYQTKNVGNHGLLGRMVKDFSPQNTYWNNQPTMSAQAIYNQNPNLGWINIDVTFLAQLWYQYNLKVSDYRPGFIGFHDDTEGDGSINTHYRQFFAQNYNNESNKPSLTINYHAFNAAYSLSGIHDSKVGNNYSMNLNVTNTGSDFTWGTDNTQINCLLQNHTTGSVQSFAVGLPYNMASGSSANIPINFTLDTSPGNYSIMFDVFNTSLGYFSDRGVPIGQASFNVADYPIYAAAYTADPSTTIIAGDSRPINITITNTSRTFMDANSFLIGYHLSDNETGLEISSVKIPLTRSIYQAWSGDSLTMQLAIQAPFKIGTYTVKWGLYQENIGWWTEKGITSLDSQLIVTAPSFAATSHLGSEDYYATAGPIDLATGGLTYSANDASMPSAAGTLDIGRTYSSNSYNSTYTANAKGYIPAWLINGPYNEADKTTRFAQDYIGEAKIKPSKGMVTNNRVWFEANTGNPDGIMDLNAIYNSVDGIKNKGNISTYLSTYVYSPKDVSCTLKFSSDSEIKVWLNDKNIFSNDTWTSIIIGGTSINLDWAELFDKRIKRKDVTLNSGWNKLIFKVAQGTEANNLSARLLSRKGATLPDIKFALNNPSMFQGTSSLGKSWAPNFDYRLDGSDAGNIYFKDGTGTINIYAQDKDGSYIKPAGSNWNLTKNSDGSYSIFDKYKTKMNFRPDGKIMNKTDSMGNQVVYNYDTLGNCIKIYDKSVTKAGTRYYSLNYTNGLLSSVKDHTGRTILTYAYNTDQQLIKVTDILGKSISYEYNGDGKMIKNTNKSGASTNIEFTNGKISSLVDFLGNKMALSYTATSTEGVVNIIDNMSRNTSLSYNLNTGLLSRSTDATGYSTHYDHDSDYNVSKVTPLIPENNELYYAYNYKYDSDGNLISMTDPLSNVTNYEYQNNYPTKSTDANGNVTTNVYNTNGLLTSSVDAQNNITTYSYDTNGRLLSATDPKSNKTSYVYNSDGDKIAEITPKGEKTQYGYDSLGRQTSMTTPLGYITKMAYDNLDRLIEIKDAGGLSNKIAYDSNNNVIKQTNPKGYSKTYNYDAANHLVLVTDELGATTAYEYDKAGNQTKVTDAKGKSVLYEYDSLNQLTKITDARGKEAKIVYDKNGNITSSSDLNGNQFSQTVNKVGQPVDIKTPNGTSGVSYDKNGNILKVGDNTNSLNLIYNSNNALTNTKSTSLGDVSTTYDKGGNIAKIIGIASTVNFAYDANNTISKVSQVMINTGATLSNSFINDADGRLVQINKSDGETSDVSYDVSNRISKIANKSKIGGQITSYAYQYDANSNVTKVTNQAGNTKNYVYDARDQLKGEDGLSYTYDLSGNRLKMTLSSFSNLMMWTPSQQNYTSYAYDDQDGNRLTKATRFLANKVVGSTSYTYDNNGNLVNKTDDKGKATQYTYDADNYFTKAIMPDGTKVEYTYDKVTKLRTSRTETAPDGKVSVINFVWEGDRLVGETDANKNTICAFTWGDDEKLVSITLPDSKGIQKTFFYLKNAKGDILGMTDENGKQVASYDYDAWGNIISSTTSANSPIADIDKLNPRLYSSYWYDATLGNYFMKVRLYDPSIGRFLSKDPLQSGISAISYNPYVYCNNNPIINIDPSGKGFWNAAKNFISRHQTAIEITVAITLAVVVTVVTLGAGAGIGAAMIFGAIVGAIGSALVYTAANWGHLSWKGYAKSIAIGAGTGAAVGAAIGSFVAAVNGVETIIGAETYRRLLNIQAPVVEETSTASLRGVAQPMKEVGMQVYTKSSLQQGQAMHSNYKMDIADGVTKFKEYRLPSGKRIDFIDFGSKTINELKPYNPRGINAGNNQLSGYKNEIESIFGPGWNTLLDLY